MNYFASSPTTLATQSAQRAQAAFICINLLLL